VGRKLRRRGSKRESRKSGTKTLLLKKLNIELRLKATLETNNGESTMGNNDRNQQRQALIMGNKDNNVTGEKGKNGKIYKEETQV